MKPLKDTSMRRRRTDRRRSGERGASLVEFAVIAPLFFLMLFGLIDFGWVISQSHDLRAAANVGVRTAAVSEVYGGDTAAKTANLVSQIKSRATQLDGTSLEVRVAIEDTNTSGTTGDAGDYVIVCLRYPANSLTGMADPFLPDVLETKAIMRIEKDSEFSAGDGSSPSWTGGSCSS